MEYKLLAADMDGTALNDKKELSPRTVRAMEKAIAKGKIVVFSTGRGITIVKPYIDMVHGMRYALTSSGAAVLDLEALKKCDYREAIKSLRKVRGIGEKVANCVVLFGLNHMEAFPIDVWMKRELKENFPPDFNPESLGEYAGLAQQYIFYYARSMGK